MLVDVYDDYRLIMKQLIGNIQSADNTRSSFRGVAGGLREARPAATNPESSNLLWIPGSLAKRRAFGMTMKLTKRITS
jgi:hypothetical protein